MGLSVERCSSCRASIRLGQRFCPQCGARLALLCAYCGRPSPCGDKFCGHCGTLLLPAGGEGLESERKQVTVLFADLKGSMELLADRDLEEGRKLIDPVLERMMEGVHRYGGTVNQVMGDGIMALFGAPLAHEDHAVRACYAALRMQEAIAELAEAIPGSDGMPLQIRVGLNSGEVIVRAIGSDLHLDYTAVGRTTHLAARMEQMATPGTILLASRTRELAEGYVQVAARGPVAVKGLAQPVQTYALIGASPQRTRLHAAATRGLTRFVGRRAEVEELQRALALAREGQGQLVAVVGEPGVGKSRFVYELTHSCRAREWLILEASSVSYGKATSYLPVIDLLKAYFQVHDRQTSREILEKVTGTLLRLDAALESIVPAVLALLDVPVAGSHWQALDPAERRRRTLDAVKHLLLWESRERPVLVVLEDLQWIDAETQALLDDLVESLGTARILLLVNYRPEYRHAWSSKAYYRQLRLDTLPPDCAAELLSALLGDGEGLEPVRRMLVKRGNPFFIEESIRTLVETGALTPDGSTYRLAQPIQAIEVPATVQVILAARIDRLPADAKRLLQTAAVIGKVVPLVLLHAVTGMTEDVAQRGLAHLQASEFLYQARRFPDPAYTFKHALTHEVAYGTLLQERRKLLHGHIVGAIERSYPDRLTEHVEQLAHHAVRGGMWEPALRYLRLAGAKALARSANREAVACFEQALGALGHLPETPETWTQAIDLRFDLRTALHPLGEFERIRGCLREAEGLARMLGDRRRLGQMSVYMCHNLWMTGHPTEAVGFGQDAQAIAESLGDGALQVTGALYLGAACLWTGDYPRAEQLLGKVLQLLEGDRCGERFGLAGFPAVMARCYLTLVFADRGHFPEGIAHGQEGIRLAAAFDHPYSLTFACWVLGHLHVTRGELDQGIRLLERALEVSREWNLTSFAANETGSLGHAYALGGRIAEGLPMLDGALSAVERAGHGNLQALFLMYLGEVHSLADRLDDALAFAGRALTFARERGHRGHEARALRLLGEIAARRDPLEHADRHYRDALTLARELGMDPLVAHCYLGLGTLARRGGHPEAARAHLTLATSMYRGMGMRSWRDRADAELGRVGRDGGDRWSTVPTAR
jgi:class 3 adenylate cyclase